MYDQNSLIKGKCGERSGKFEEHTDGNRGGGKGTRYSEGGRVDPYPP